MPVNRSTTMSCETAFELMSASLDGEVGADEARALRSHLTGCARCAARQQELRVVTGRLRGRSARALVAPERLRARILAGLPAPAPRSWRPLGLGLALAGAAALGAITAVAARPALSPAGGGPGEKPIARGDETPPAGEAPAAMAAAQPGPDHHPARSAELSPEGAPAAPPVPTAVTKRTQSPAPGAPSVVANTITEPDPHPGGDSPVPADPHMKAAEPEPRVAAGPAAWNATIRGVVTLAGAMPARGNGAADGCTPDETAAYRGKADGLADVHVRVQGAPTGFPRPPARPAMVVQTTACGFRPRVIGLMQGDPARFVFGPGEPSARSVMADGMVPFAVSAGEIPFTSPRLAEGRGDFAVHALTHEGLRGPRGHVVATTHPFFAVSDEDGAFTIAGLPPGRHRLSAWHPEAGERSIEVEVDLGPATTAEVRITFPAPGASLVAAAPRPAEPVAGLALTKDPHRCQIAITGRSPVAVACAEGGIRRAKTTMKTLVKLAKARGFRYDCDTCHRDETTWELSGGARDKLREMLDQPGG